MIQNLEVFYQRSGSGKVLFCIHGFPSSSWDFEAIWPSLSNRFDVIAHDLIGLGKSSKTHIHLTVSLQADIIEGLAQHLGIKEAHILAHDLGDTIAQELLARQADGTSKIKWLTCVLFNGGIFPGTYQPLFIQKLLLSPLGPLVIKFMTKKAFKKSMVKIFSKQHPPSAEFIDETWKLTSENNGLAQIPKLIQYMAERKKYRERWVSPLVKGIVPIRLIDGADDPISGRHMADRFVEIVPNADVVYIKNSGHYPHVETPDEVVEAFFDFHDKLIESKLSADSPLGAGASDDKKN